MDPWARGMIWGMHLAKVPRTRMAELVEKTDGSKPKVHAIDMVIARKKSDPAWRGESGAGGRPEILTAAQKAASSAL